MKPMSRRQHGFVDYGVTALELALAHRWASRRLRASARARAPRYRTMNVLDPSTLP